MRTQRSPDEIVGAQIHALGLHVTTLRPQEDFVLIQGSREALRFLANVIVGVANSDSLPADFSMGPASAGQFHFAESATEGLYISCIETPLGSGTDK